MKNNSITSEEMSKEQTPITSEVIQILERDYIGKECFFIDKVTHKKTYEGRELGKCVGVGIHSLHKLPIVWFEKPFLGFTWQYESDVRLQLNQNKNVFNVGKTDKPLNT